MTDDIVTRLRVATVADSADSIYKSMTEAADEIERLRTERNRWRRLAHWQHHPDSSKCYDQRTCECVELDYEAMIDMEKKAVQGE